MGGRCQLPLQAEDATQFPPAPSHLRGQSCLSCWCRSSAFRTLIWAIPCKRRPLIGTGSQRRETGRFRDSVALGSRSSHAQRLCTAFAQGPPCPYRVHRIAVGATVPPTAFVALVAAGHPDITAVIFRYRS